MGHVFHIIVCFSNLHDVLLEYFKLLFIFYFKSDLIVLMQSSTNTTLVYYQYLFLYSLN